MYGHLECPVRDLIEGDIPGVRLDVAPPRRGELRLLGASVIEAREGILEQLAHVVSI